jgi:hypothetical protein
LTVPVIGVGAGSGSVPVPNLTMIGARGDPVIPVFIR